MMTITSPYGYKVVVELAANRRETMLRKGSARIVKDRLKYKTDFVRVLHMQPLTEEEFKGAQSSERPRTAK